MLKFIGKLLKWTAVTIASLLFVGFLYVWFILLAKPGEVSFSGEIKDREWHTVALGNPTVCSDGSPFSIFARKGSSDNLIIHFSGGGACWDNPTCASPMTLMNLFDSESKELTAYYVPRILKVIPAILSGLLDQEPSNPFKDWNVVYIPYCTGDLHVGNAVNSYSFDGRKFDVHHNGRNNSLTALQWVFDNFKNPGKILVSGESAGAYASAFWAPVVAQQYENKKIYQLSDGSLITSGRWNEIMDTVWKAETQSRLKFKIGKDIFEDAMLQRQDSLNYRIKHLQSNTIYDGVLTRFSAALNHTSTSTNDFIDDWSLKMLSSMKRLDDSGLEYAYFLSDCQYNSKNHTTPHTLTGIYYNNCSSDQVSYPDWLKKNIIDDVSLSVGDKFLGPLTTIPRK